MGLLSKRILVLLFTFMVVVFLGMKLLFDREIEKANSNELEQYDNHIRDSIASLVDEKKKVTQALAIAFSSRLDLRSSLNHSPQKISKELFKFTENLRKHSAYKQVWIQLLDSEGVSLGRSWSKKHGDDLTLVRLDIASVVEQPRRLSSFSVGKFSLSFKCIVPLFDEQNRFVGIVDVITQINSVDDSLKKMSGARSIVLVHDSYHDQLTKVDKNRFVDRFYVANEGFLEEDVTLLSKIGLKKLFSSTGYIRQDGFFISTERINNIKGEPMALWVVIKPLHEFAFEQTQKLKFNLIVTYSVIFLLFLLLLFVFYMRYKALLEKQFFSQFFEQSTEEICIFSGKELVKANPQFLNLFFKSKSMAVSSFNKRYDNFTEIFVEGFLDEKHCYKGLYWLEYLLREDEGKKVRIYTRYGEQTFIAKASKINDLLGDEYVVLLLTNVSKEELYLEKLEKLIVTDELTGVKNRHYFNNELASELKRAKRYNEPLALSIIDIDYFKLVNDEFGHDAGDVTLVKMSEVIQHELRETDKFCRIGGEEFAVIMPETDLESALIISDRLRLAVQRISTKMIPKAITISLGVCEFNLWDNFNSIYKRADEALYKAKDNGRNRVETIDDLVDGKKDKSKREES